MGYKIINIKRKLRWLMGGWYFGDMTVVLSSLLSIHRPPNKQKEGRPSPVCGGQQTCKLLKLLVAGAIEHD